MGKSSFSFTSLSADRVGRGLGFKREFSALDGEASCLALYPEIKPLRFSFLRGFRVTLWQLEIYLCLVEVNKNTIL